MDSLTNKWEIFWNAISAISTFLAVLVSLWLARRRKKIKLSLHQYWTYWDDGRIDLIITVKNVGDFPVAITEFGFCDKSDKRNKRKINTDCKRFLKDKSLNRPFKILAGDIQLIEFELIPHQEDDYYYNLIKNQIESNGSRFVVRDSENKHY